MTTPDPAAIEAGARALCDAEWKASGMFDQLVDGAEGRRYWLSQAEIAYAAMEPHIRKTVAEEIAQALESRAAPKVNPRYQQTHYLLPERAAAIAREIGARP